MNIMVRGMIQTDIEDLSRAFAAQGWLLPTSVFENYYRRMLQKYCDMLVAEVKGQLAGYLRLEWVDAGDAQDHLLMPEIQEFVVLNRYAGTGVAESLHAEAERRVCYRTGEAPENALMAVYGSPPPHPLRMRSFVLDGLFVSGEGHFIRARTAGDARRGFVISMRR